MDFTQPSSLVTASFFSGAALQELGTACQNRKKTVPILLSIWPDHNIKETNVHESDYKCLFQYFVNEISPLKDSGADYAVNSFTGTRDLLVLLKKWRNQSKVEIINSLRQHFLNFSDDSIIRSVELTLRFCLTINVQSPRISLNPVISNAQPIEWHDNITLDTLIKDQFQETRPEQTSGLSRPSLIDPRFTAHFLASVPGIRVEWTSNLASHLVYNRHRRTVLVYEHKIALIHHLASEDPWIPREVIVEALDTMNLLFPFDGSTTRNFLQSHNKTLYALGQQGRPRLLDLREYKFWGGALQELINASEEPAHDWRALWRDRRNKVQFWTFWIAMLVLVLTVFGFVFTLFGGVYTYRQYDLARLQACSGDGVPEVIQRKYCD